MKLFASAILCAGFGASALGTVPSSEGYLTVEPGVRLHYVRLGNGRQVVVSPMASWLALPLSALARADRTLIFYDTRGRARSDRIDPSKVSLANELSDLDAVRRHFGLESMALMGWSHYGMMTAVYAIQNPARVTRLIQITPGAPRSDPYLKQGMETAQSRMDMNALEALAGRKKAGEFEKDPAGYCRALKAIMRPAYFANRADVSKMTFDDCALETEWPEYQEAWWRALFSSMTPWDYRAQARALRAPRLVIQGEKDFIPLEASREWAEGNPDARLLVIHGVGHHPFVENPTEFLGAVGTFLDSRWPEGAVAVPPAADAPKNAFALVREARAAYDHGDVATFLKNYEEAARLRPGDVWILYNLACGQALNGQPGAAVRTLQDFAAHRVAADLEADKDLGAIRKTEGYRKVVEEMEALRKERISSGAVVAFTIPEKELAPEGVAYDPVSRFFFVASVRKGKVARISTDGQASDFIPAGRGLRSALGMGADPVRRTLWVASEAIPQMNGARKGDPPESSLFEFELDTGKLRREHRPPASPDPPFFDDLAVGADGRVYVNDGRTPRIYMWSPEKGELELFLESDAMRGTQGLAVTPDGKTLYASDYGGLYRIDVLGKSVTPIPVPPDLSLSGVDGLVYFEGSLVAIQNGIEPHRVIRLDLAADGLRIAGSRILEMNHPLFDEPTLGTVAGGALYFSANNEGHRYYDLKNPPRPEDLREAVVLKLPLR